MLSRDPTFLGTVEGVAGSTVSVQLAPSLASGISIIRGQTYRVGQVGSFVRVPQGYQDLYGVILAVGADALPETQREMAATGRWVRVELIGEAIGTRFERGVGQYPNIGDSVHIAIESDLKRIYGEDGEGFVTVGELSSASSILARVALKELVTRHAAILGSTGAGKSTTVASLVRAITASGRRTGALNSARILLLDVHGEYSRPLADISTVFAIEPQSHQLELFVPYWALNAADLLDFLLGSLNDNQERVVIDKILELKSAAYDAGEYPGVDLSSITVDTPIPFSLNQLWYDLIDVELRTFSDSSRTKLAKIADGDASQLIPPRYEPPGMGSAAPFLNNQAPGIRRQLNLLRSRLLDRRYSFILSPGKWSPDLFGTPTADLDVLLEEWLGGDKPVTILDLSAVPSLVLERMIGSILTIVYEALYWSRGKSEGGVARPLLVVMEEAHRYLAPESDSAASSIVRRIAKEGRKYGVGALVVSQRPSEVDETILSQCGTLFAMRLTNPADRGRVKGTLSDGIAGLLDALPILRTGEAIVTGESARLPMRCKIALPSELHRPDSGDPDVVGGWSAARRIEKYDRVVASWRAQNALAVIEEEKDISRTPVEDSTIL